MKTNRNASLRNCVLANSHVEICLVFFFLLIVLPEFQNLGSDGLHREESLEYSFCSYKARGDF